MVDPAEIAKELTVKLLDRMNSDVIVVRTTPPAVAAQAVATMYKIIFDAVAPTCDSSNKPA